MAGRKSAIFKAFVEPDYFAQGVAIKRDDLDEFMKLKEGMQIKVVVGTKFKMRTISKIYKHFVLAKSPRSGYNECFTKAEVYIHNFHKNGVRR